jgi:hypothetical protein
MSGGPRERSQVPLYQDLSPDTAQSCVKCAEIGLGKIEGGEEK